MTDRVNPRFRDGLICRVCHPPKSLRARLRVAWLIATNRPVPGGTVRVYEPYTPENPSGFSIHKRAGLRGAGETWKAADDRWRGHVEVTD